MSQPGIRENALRGLGLVLAIAPAIVYFTVVASHAANIPRGDDYAAILQFLADWTQAPNFAAKLGILWEQFFSHRIVLTRLAAVASLALLGECDLRILQVLGWLGWLALAVGLAFSTPLARAQPWRVMPIFLLLMQPQGYTNLHIAMQAVQNIGVVTLAFAAFHAALATSRGWFIPGLALALSAALTSINGLLVFPTLVATFLIQRDLRRALFAGVVGATIWGVFFYDFVREARPFAFGEFLHNAAAMTGGFLQFERLPLAFVSVVGGVLLLATGALLAFPATWRRWPTHATFLLFLGLTVAMAAAGRIGWGADYMLQDRYRLYGLLMTATLMAVALEAVPSRQQRWALGACFAAAALCCGLSYIVTLPNLLSAARWAEATAMNHQLGESFPATSAAAWNSSAVAVQQAQIAGAFRMPVRFSTKDIKCLVDAVSDPAPPSTIRASFRAEANGGIDGALLTTTTSPLAQPEFAVLRLADRTLVLPVERWRAPFSDIARRASIFREDFALVLPGAIYATGQHRLLGFRRDASGQLAMIWSGFVECPPLPFAAARIP